MKRQRQYFGWQDPITKVYWLSKFPPDAPVRRAVPFRTLAELNADVERRRGQVYWDPLLPGMVPADNRPTPTVAEKPDPDRARAAAADFQQQRQATHRGKGIDIWKGWPKPY